MCVLGPSAQARPPDWALGIVVRLCWYLAEFFELARPTELRKVNGLLQFKLVKGLGQAVFIAASNLLGSSSKREAELVCAWVVKVNQEFIKVSQFHLREEKVTGSVLSL
jgi:hypothetical protein